MSQWVFLGKGLLAACCFGKDLKRWKGMGIIAINNGIADWTGGIGPPCRFGGGDSDILWDD